MENTLSSTTHPSAEPVSTLRPITSPRFDLLFALMSVWFVVGLLVDTWAHSFNAAGAQETFFTAWHGLFYTGYLAVALPLLREVWRNRTSAGAWRAAIPRGYGLSMLGLGMFVIGGGLDPVWHIVVGREVRLDILMSPTHIFFTVAMVLTISGPIRAAWHRSEAAPALRRLMPVLISMLLVHWMFTFQTLYSHPIEAYPSTFQRGTLIIIFSDMMGTSGFITHTAILMGLLLILMRRWRLPVGSFTFVIGGHYLMLAPQHYYYPAIVPLVASMVVAGAAVDMLYARLKPTIEGRRGLYLFAFFATVILYSFYFAAIYLFDQVAWTVHLVVGNIAIAGLTGLALAALVSTIAAPLVRD